MRSLLLFTILLTLFISCSSDSSVKEIDLSAISLDLKINQLEQEQLNLIDTAKARAFLEKYPSFTQLMLKRSLPSQKILEGMLVKMANDVHNQELLEACQQDYKDFSDLEEKLLTVFKHVKYYYPEFTINEVNTFSGGLTSGYDLVINDQSLFIGIDHFLKDKEKFRPNPQVFHNYILKFYNRENIPVKVAQLLSQQYNAYDVKDQTLLANIIFYGKAYYFVKQMNAADKDALVIEYDDQEWAGAEQHAHIIWDHFVKKELFYTTDKKLISKYVDPRPTTGEVAEACPGRIGQWLGFKIVESYMKNNPEVSLQDLMNETNSQKILQNSRYRPTK